MTINLSLSCEQPMWPKQKPVPKQCFAVEKLNYSTQLLFCYLRQSCWWTRVLWSRRDLQFWSRRMRTTWSLWSCVRRGISKGLEVSLGTLRGITRKVLHVLKLRSYNFYFQFNTPSFKWNMTGNRAKWWR